MTNLLKVSTGLGLIGATLYFSGVILNTTMASNPAVIYQESSPFNTIDIDVSASGEDNKLTIVQGDTFSINLTEGVSYAVENDKLTIYYKDSNTGVMSIFKSKLIKNNNSIEITVTVPPTAVFDRVDIDYGLGEVYIDTLVAEKFNLDLGVADTIVNNITASVIEIDGGVGKCTASNLNAEKILIDNGVGVLELNNVTTNLLEIAGGVGTSKAFNVDATEIVASSGVGDIEIEGKFDYATLDGGVGAIKLTTAHPYDYYTYLTPEAEGIMPGSLKINGNKVSGIINYKEGIVPTIQAEIGVGAIKIFTN